MRQSDTMWGQIDLRYGKRGRMPGQTECRKCGKTDTTAYIWCQKRPLRFAFARWIRHRQASARLMVHALGALPGVNLNEKIRAAIA
jgi:hypothetical protein